MRRNDRFLLSPHFSSIISAQRLYSVSCRPRLCVSFFLRCLNVYWHEPKDDQQVSSEASDLLIRAGRSTDHIMSTPIIRMINSFAAACESSVLWLSLRSSQSRQTNIWFRVFISVYICNVHRRLTVLLRVSALGNRRVLDYIRSIYGTPHEPSQIASSLKARYRHNRPIWCNQSTANLT